MNVSHRLLVFVPLALAAACGDDGESSSVDGRNDGTADVGAERTVEIRMVGNRFDPVTIEVDRGETVSFEFENADAVSHNAFVGAADLQNAREAELRWAKDASFEDLEMGHEVRRDVGLTVQPGETGELRHTFDIGGELEIG